MGRSSSLSTTFATNVRGQQASFMIFVSSPSPFLYAFWMSGSVNSSTLLSVLYKGESQRTKKMQFLTCSLNSFFALRVWRGRSICWRKISSAFLLPRWSVSGGNWIVTSLIVCWHLKLDAWLPTVPFFRVFLVRGNSVRSTIFRSSISLTLFRLRHGYDIGFLLHIPL